MGTRYVKQTWTDGSGGGTPLSAARMGFMETGIFDASSVQQIADTTLGASAANIDFTSIASTFAHLLVIAYTRADNAVGAQDLLCRFNADTAANYDSQYVRGNAATASAAESFAATSIAVGGAPGTSAGANLFGMSAFIVPHYTNAANNKIISALYLDKTGTATSNLDVRLVLGAWRSNSAINRVTLLSAAGNLVSGSRATLYGLG
jgi:hypothetical protein